MIRSSRPERWRVHICIYIVNIYIYCEYIYIYNRIVWWSEVQDRRDDVLGISVHGTTLNCMAFAKTIRVLLVDTRVQCWVRIWPWQTMGQRNLSWSNRSLTTVLLTIPLYIRYPHVWIVDVTAQPTGVDDWHTLLVVFILLLIVDITYWN